MLFYQIFFATLAVFNVYTFGLMMWDKRQAKQGKWRIAENRFFQLALFGGSLGVLIAMPVLRHKNQKKPFKWRIYGIILLHVVLLSAVLAYF